MRPRTMKGSYSEHPSEDEDEDEAMDADSEDSQEEEDDDEDLQGVNDRGAGSGGAPHRLAPTASDGEDGDMDDDDEEDEDEEDEDEDDGASEEDLDAQEVDRRRAELAAAMQDMERQFAILKEQLYRERQAQVSCQLAAVHAGSAEEYLEPLSELEGNMRAQLAAAEFHRDLRVAAIECKRQAEQQAAAQDYENERRMIHEKLEEEIEEKLRLLEEDYEMVNVQLWSSSNQFSSSGKGDRERRRPADPEDPDQRRKPVSADGPVMVYRLDDMDILQDWAVLRKLLPRKK